MYDGTLPSDQVKRFQRVSASAAVTIHRKDGAVRLGRLYQAGAAKIRLPKSYASHRVDVTLINTAGGLTGGDVFEVAVSVDDGAAACVTTQACEKIYRSLEGDAAVTNRLSVGAGARLAWMPQETIFYDRAALFRKLEAAVHPDGSLFALEPMVFGRAAMGETVKHGALRDAWTVRRGDALAYAERSSLTGEIVGALARPGIMRAATAYASGVYIGPEMERVRDAIRAVKEPEGVTAGASIMGKAVTIRCVASDGMALRRWIAKAYRAAWGEELPRVWGC
ncbi:urease accessory protein UreD [Hwanghaeella sp.]|uniref:urease accessory protein UreD n=1 Tax=Hwanghaeella sp. TaxID=2605943 RepID=UPI003CCB8353